MLHEESSAHSIDDKVAVIKGNIEGTDYALAIEEVREVCDLTNIAYYPENVAGYLGIINLRGQVIPILCLSEKKKNLHGARLLIIEQAGGGSFGVIAHKIQKMMVSKSEIADKEILNINGTPVRFTSADALLPKREEE